MRLLVAFTQAGGGHVGINLGGGQTAMSEQFLHGADIGTAVEHVGGKTVSEGMRARAPVQARLREIFFQQSADAASRQPRTFPAQE